MPFLSVASPSSALSSMKELISVLAAASSLCKELGASASEKELGYTGSASSMVLRKRWCWSMWREPRKAAEGGTGRRVRIEGHERCVCDGGSEEDGHDSEECHQELGEQAAAVGHGGRWPTLTSEERLGTVRRK
jgi:hypothetical protein